MCRANATHTFAAALPLTPFVCTHRPTSATTTPVSNTSVCSTSSVAAQHSIAADANSHVRLLSAVRASCCSGIDHGRSPCAGKPGMFDPKGKAK